MPVVFTAREEGRMLQMSNWGLVEALFVLKNLRQDQLVRPFALTGWRFEDRTLKHGFGAVPFFS